MAEDGEANNTLRRVVSELGALAGDGQHRWRARRGRSDLSVIEALISKGSGKQPGPEEVCDAIKDACEGLDATAEWKRAAKEHLGYGKDAPHSRVEREEAAAACLRSPTGSGAMSLSTYRRKSNQEVTHGHNGRPYAGKLYDSWSGVTLALVAESLIRNVGADPGATVDGEGEALEERLADPDCQPLGDIVRHEIAGRYRALSGADLQVSFFHRASTDHYIDAIAALDRVTLYTGVDVSTEVRTPLSDRLMAGTLRERLHARTDLSEDQQTRLVGALMAVYPPSFLGSIAREFVRGHSRIDHHRAPAMEWEARAVFAQDLERSLTAGRSTGGFLALGLGALSFALRKAGRSVQILTTNYDNRIDQDQSRIYKYFEGLRGFSFAPSALDASPDGDLAAVALYSLNGDLASHGDASSEPLIIGEADALTDHNKPRSELVTRALSETSCVFVGSSLTEPDLLDKLVNTPYRYKHNPRYALVLAPKLDLERPEERELKARALELVADRYLHLGIVPIVIDFPHQVPQFLIEVALRLEQGAAYKSYPRRLDEWWAWWARHFGFGGRQAEHGGRRRREVQQIWWEELEKVRRRVITEYLGLPAAERDRDEQIQVEVWLRNPRARSLVHSASSEGMWMYANTAHRCSVHEGEEYAVQRAFREGAPIHGPIRQPRGIWRHQMSFPLVLRREPWHHLPVGVVTILSSKDASLKDEKGETVVEGGALGDFPRRDSFAKDLAAMVSEVRKPINELLDPHSRLCRRKQLGAYAKRRPAGTRARSS
jgi:hypothetical protein